MESPTKLFTTEQVKKFFHILERLSGSIPVDKSHYPWKNYQTIYTKESEHCPSTREVFVHRTISKWLKGKSLIIYRVSDMGITYKQYLSVSSIAHYNDWSVAGHIGVGLIDYSAPYNGTMFCKEKFGHNECLDLEGEWCEDLSAHAKIMELVSMASVPEKEYVFKAWDFDKLKRKSKHNPDPKKSIETTKSFTSRTEHEAYEAKRKFEERNKEDNGRLYVGELIEVRVL